MVLLLLAHLAAHANQCAAVPSLERLLKPGSALLLGEIHGTVESPAFA